MATCKDCIHYKVCTLATYHTDLKTKKCSINPKKCKKFKDRSKFIELPCELGDKVFYFDTAGRIYEQTIFQFIYGGTGLKLDSDVMFDSELIGKRFFLSREEAEQALRERN